jgi:hypothetical protein
LPPAADGGEVLPPARPADRLSIVRILRILRCPYYEETSFVLLILNEAGFVPSQLRTILSLGDRYTARVSMRRQQQPRRRQRQNLMAAISWWPQYKELI